MKSEAIRIMQGISIVFPSRGRPKRAAEMIDSVFETLSKNCLIEFIIYIDVDDPESEKYFQIPISYKQVKIIQGPKIWLSLIYNTLATRAAYDVIMYGSDDILFKSNNWDQRVLSEISHFPNNVGLVYPNDLSSWQGKIATHGFVHKNWIEAIGYFLPPYFPDVFSDTWITNLAGNLNRIAFMEDVIIEHNQYRQGKSEFDITYRDRIISTKSRNSGNLYKRLTHQLRLESVLAADKLNIGLKYEKKYAIASLLIKFTYFKNDKFRKMKILSTSNVEIFKIGSNSMIRKMKYFYKLSWRNPKNSGN